MSEYSDASLAVSSVDTHTLRCWPWFPFLLSLRLLPYSALMTSCLNSPTNQSTGCLALPPAVSRDLSVQRQPASQRRRLVNRPVLSEREREGVVDKGASRGLRERNHRLRSVRHSGHPSTPLALKLILRVSPPLSHVGLLTEFASEQTSRPHTGASLTGDRCCLPC
jgi:hypothetical protein